MKSRKLTVAGIAAVIAVLIISFSVGSGFIKRTDVVLTDYSVSTDRTQITLKTSVLSSMGNTRGLVNDGGGAKSHYLSFYSTFGGLNNKFGAESEFVLEIDKNDEEIYFNRPDGGYELVLKKDAETGAWERVVN